MSNSPWSLVAPQSGLSAASLSASARVSAGARGRPPRDERHRQKSLNPARCQARTVAGWTRTSTFRHRDQSLESTTQKRRSTECTLGRGLRAWWTASCCRRARFSSTSVRRDESAEPVAARSAAMRVHGGGIDGLSLGSPCITRNRSRLRFQSTRADASVFGFRRVRGILRRMLTDTYRRTPPTAVAPFAAALVPVKTGGAAQ